MKRQTYNIKHSVREQSYPVEVLFQTKSIILHRPINKQGTKCRHFNITLKDVPNFHLANEGLNDVLICGSFSKISDCKLFIEHIEANYDLNDVRKLIGNKEFHLVVDNFRYYGLSNLGLDRVV